MAKSRVEKNKKLYDDLDTEMKNNKEQSYEEKLKAIDPKLGEISEKQTSVSEKGNKKGEEKKKGALVAIAKEVSGKERKKHELVKVKEEKRKKNELVVDERLFEKPIAFTDKLSVEEILRAKIEQQERLKQNKKLLKKSPNDSSYTPEMMQERIRQHEGVDVRKETKIKTKNFKSLVLGLLFVALIAVIIVGILLIFKIIRL